MAKNVEMNNKAKCSGGCSCSHHTASKVEEKNTINYSFYSNVLNKPFKTLAELTAAEAAHIAEQKAKEDKAATKKADAMKVEEAFKALNQARKDFKEDLSQLTTEYSEALADLKKAFEHGKKDIHNTLADAENAYTIALREFTEKYPEGYHITLKDGDFETTISGSNTTKTSVDKDKAADIYSDIFKLIFGIN